MKFFRLIYSALFAKKIRTFLTLGSLIAAYVLFGLLQAVNVLFSAAESDDNAANRVVTQSRVSFTQSLPLRMLPEIESVKGVQRVMYQQWFGAEFQSSDNQLVAFAIDPPRLKDVYPEFKMTDAEWQKFTATRTGAIVGRSLASRFGWKVGQQLPLNSNIFPKKDGSKSWTFEIVGLFSDTGAGNAEGSIYINFAYFDEARQFGNGQAGIFVSRLTDPALAESVVAAIDAKYLNSPDETKSQSEKEWALNFVRQIGDINLIVNSILAAVFFTILLLTGNTMAQAVRERIPQYAVLKTLGFTDRSVLGLVLGESFLLIAIGAVIGMLIATFVGFGLAKYLQSSGSLVDGTVWLYAAISVVVMALAVGVPPAWRAMRLKIVDALAGR
jgi:putative ABC transport system permease protein